MAYFALGQAPYLGRNQGVGRRVGIEITADPGQNRVSQFALVLPIVQQPFFGRVRNIGHFNQDRRHIGRLEHE